MKAIVKLTLLSIVLFISHTVFAGTNDSEIINSDPHYSDIGFFDVHLCNWPDRPRFFKLLFSSTHYPDIDSMQVYTPDDRLLAELDKKKYRTITRKNKPDKRVFMVNIDVPAFATNGWYRIKVTTQDGKIHEAKDYVILSRLQGATGLQPAGEDEEFDLPIKLSWNPVPGAQFYQVYVRDAWTGEMIFQSKLVDKPELVIPDGKLEPGGYYSWSVHARDSNENVLLGDFEMGSISEHVFFNVTDTDK